MAPSETPAVTAVSAVRAAVGEAPRWDPGRRTVRWVDIPAGAVHDTDLGTGETATTVLPTSVGATVRAAGGGLAATGTGFALLDEDDRIREELPVLPAGTRMNDAACDRAGRMWAGSTAHDFAAGRGALHLLDADRRHTVLLDGLTQPNGMGWSPDGRTFYLVETQDALLLAFDLAEDPGRGPVLSRRRVLRDLGDERGLPDGLCVDATGHLWLAMYGGGCLLCLSADGATVARLAMPVLHPTSCAFVGEQLDLLCVTTAAQDRPPGDALAGALLLVGAVGPRGLPAHDFAG